MPLGSLVRIALVQFAPLPGDVEANLRTAKMLSGKKKADIFVFPHLFSSAAEPQEASRYAEDDDGPTPTMLQELAISRKAYAIGSYLAKTPHSIAKSPSHGKPSYRYVVFNPDGICAAKYDQIHLSSIAAENDYVSPGSSLPFFDALTFRSSVIGSYDLRFPELAREFGLSWGFLLFAGGAYKSNEIHQWDALLQARATENQMFAIGCNFGQEKKKKAKNEGGQGKTGADAEGAGSASDPLDFGGHSAVYAPDGRMLHRAGENEQVLVLDINPFEVEWCRNRYQYLTDAKVELHKRHVFESQDDPDK